MRKSLASLLILLFLISLLTLPPATVKAQSKTIIVPDDYATIEDALTNAAQGDIVFVKKGTYHETLKIEKSISLLGEDRDTTIIEGILREGVKVPLTINQNNVSVTGFTLRDGYAGIQLHGNFCRISGNRITNTQSGIILTSGLHNNITANIVESTRFCGIKLAIATSNSIQRNQIVSANDGIEITQTSHYNTISENNMVNNVDRGIWLSYSDGNTLIGNNITNSGFGIIIYVAKDNNLYRNNFVNNTEQVSADEWYAKTFGYGGSTNTFNENFWSDYQSKYPNAKEVDASGIGDTPYVINENNTDYRPLMRQVDISALVPTTTPKHTGGSPTPLSSQESFLTVAVVAIPAVAVVMAGILLVFFRKRRLSRDELVKKP